MTHVFIDPLRWLRKFHILFEQFIIWKIGYVFLSYLYKEQVSWFFFSFKKHTQHKEFLERKLQWWFLGSEKRIRRKGNSISFIFLFHLLFVILPASISSNSQKVTFVQWATESSTAVQNKNATAAPLSALSPPSHLLPNATTQNRSAVWLSRRQTGSSFLRHLLDFEFEFHENSS